MNDDGCVEKNKSLHGLIFAHWARYLDDNEHFWDNHIDLLFIDSPCHKGWAGTMVLAEFPRFSFLNRIFSMHQDLVSEKSKTDNKILLSKFRCLNSVFKCWQENFSVSGSVQPLPCHFSDAIIKWQSYIHHSMVEQFCDTTVSEFRQTQVIWDNFSL